MRPVTLKQCPSVWCVDYQPRGDQATPSSELTRGIRDGEKHQVLLGVTGSGKTFTMAKVIEAIGRPALVLAHNKTLAAQLYHEFKTFFPDQRRRVFRQLLRLLPARSLHSLERRLHRKGSHHQRRARQAAAFRHAVAVRAARLRHRRERELHLRPGFARGLLRHAADAGKGPEDHAQGDRVEAGGDSLRPQRWRFPPRHVPRARRRDRSLSHLRRLRLPHRTVGRRGGEPVADRSAAGAGEADLSAAADLSEDALRDVADDEGMRPWQSIRDGTGMVAPGAGKAGQD